MSIRFGTSITRRRRAYDRRCRGARDGAMAATTAIPPRRDRKRTATHARATAGMQVRGANVQHSNARGRSATFEVARPAQRGCPEGRDGTSLYRERASSIGDNPPGYGENCAPAVQNRPNRTGSPSRTALNASVHVAGLLGLAGAPLEFDEVVPRRSSRSRTRGILLRWSSSMDQPTTPAEQPTRAAERDGAVVTAPARRHDPPQRRLHRARRRRRPRAPVAHVQPDREPRRDRGDPRRLDVLPRRRRPLAAARGARDLGHARGRARHVRPHRPPLHPVAEPLRRRQVVPHARTRRCAGASRSGASSGASRSATSRSSACIPYIMDVLRGDPRELRRQHRLGPPPRRHVRRASGTARPRPIARSCCSSSRSTSSSARSSSCRWCSWPSAR